MVFACHVILQNHVIKVLSDSKVRSPSRYVTTMPSFVAIVVVEVEIKCF